MQCCAITVTISSFWFLWWHIVGRLWPAQQNDHGAPGYICLHMACTWKCLLNCEKKHTPQVLLFFNPSHIYTEWWKKSCILICPLVLIIFPLFLYTRWFSGTCPGSHTLHPVPSWHTIINKHAHRPHTSALIHFPGTWAFMGACKPHHSCGMTLPMCPLRIGTEEAPLVSITREIPPANIKCPVVSSQITFKWPNAWQH